MRRRHRAVLAAGLIGALAVPPATADPLHDLQDAREDLDAVLQRLEAAREAYALAQERLVGVRADLVAVEQRLATARTEEQAARRRHEHAAREAMRAEQALVDRRETLRDRVVQTYKHGLPTAPTVLLRTLAAADSTHDLAVATRTARRLVQRDGTIVAQASAGAVRAEATRAAAHDTAVEAAGRRRQVDSLVAAQRRLVADVEAQRTAQQRVIAELTADQATYEALIAELERRLAAVGQVLRPRSQRSFDQPAPSWARHLPGGGNGWAGAVDAAAARAGIDGRFFAALVWTESAFRADARSPVGAIGLAQLMPGTAADLGVDPTDPIENLVGGARYLRQQLGRFSDLRLALAAYNAGPGRVEAAGRAIPEIVETQLYVLSIVDRWQRLAG